MNAEPVAAFAMNPLLVVLGIPAGIALVLICLRGLGLRIPIPKAPPAWLGWLALALIVSFWIARNLPFEAFAMLRPVNDTMAP